MSTYPRDKELALEAESFRYKLVTTEDEGPMMMGSPPVLLDVIELFRLTKDVRVGSPEETRRSL